MLLYPTTTLRLALWTASVAVVAVKRCTALRADGLQRLAHGIREGSSEARSEPGIPALMGYTAVWLPFGLSFGSLLASIALRVLLVCAAAGISATVLFTTHMRWSRLTYSYDDDNGRTDNAL